MIEPLLQIKGPLQKAPLSHGFLGCLMYDTDEDKVQCHDCGRWFRYLGAHIKVHDLKDDAYRMNYGLAFNYPLCGRRFSKLRSNDVTDKFLKAGTDMRRKLKGKQRLNAKPRQVGTATESEKNRNGTCSKQVDERYKSLVLKLGHHPSSPEFRKHDRALIEVITRRYKTLNNYRELIGVSRMTVADQNRKRGANR